MWTFFEFPEHFWICEQKLKTGVFLEFMNKFWNPGHFLRMWYFLIGEQKMKTETILENSEQIFETENNFVNALFPIYVNKNNKHECIFL